LGDVLLASPLIRSLRKRFPDARIDFLVREEYAGLVRENPYLSNLIIFVAQDGMKGLRILIRRILREKYHIVLDIHGSLRTRFIELVLRLNPFHSTKIFRIRKNQFIRFLLVRFKVNLYHKEKQRVIPVWEKYLNTAKSLGVKSDGSDLDLFLPEEALEAGRKFYDSLPAGRWEVVVAPGARHFTKRWLPEYFAEVIRKLNTDFGLNTVLVGGKEDVPIIDQIAALLPNGVAVSAGGKFSILESASIIKNASLVISNDSGLMHVADAFDVPLIAIFGSTVREFGFFPHGSQAIVFENEGLYCRPCSHIGRSTCPEKHFRCMKEVTSKRIMELIRRKKFFAES